MTRTGCGRRAAGGYTLVEIAVSLMVVAVGFTSVLALFVAGLSWSKDVVANSTVALVAQSAIDDFPSAVAAGSEVGRPDELVSTDANSLKFTDMQAYSIDPAALNTDNAGDKQMTVYFTRRRIVTATSPVVTNLYEVWVAVFMSKKDLADYDANIDDANLVDSPNRPKPAGWFKCLIYQP